MVDFTMSGSDFLLFSVILLFGKVTGWWVFEYGRYFGSIIYIINAF
jgi:hypothetical protein